MKTEVRKIGSTSVLSISGKITLGEASQKLRAALDQLVLDGHHQIVLNLADVPFMDSAGLGVLAVNFANTKAAGGMLKVAEPQARVKEAVELVRLNHLFPLYATEQEAIDSFSVSDSEAPAR